MPQADRLYPYTPGKPLEQLLAEKGIANAIKLASNENSFGSSPKAVEAIREAATAVNLYPDGSATMLCQALALKHQITPMEILIGNGSNEVLELIIRTFAGVNDEVIYARRGFIVYALATVAAGATPVPVNETDGFSHDLDGMLARINTQTKVICIANQNNPTGTLLTLEALQAFLNQVPTHIVVVIDEAYHEYVADHMGESIGKLHHLGLVICRTFSKAYGLAGLRIGYAVGNTELLAWVNRFREPFNVNVVAQKAALAALGDSTWVQEKVQYCLCERERIEGFLRKHGLLAIESHANFVLLQHDQSTRIASLLEDMGIIVRPLQPYGMHHFLRITIGRKDENDRMIQGLAAALKLVTS
ncbi:MAG: histidinol-phosphate transaminase [Mariprofundaceae bacterium]